MQPQGQNPQAQQQASTAPAGVERPSQPLPTPSAESPAQGQVPGLEHPSSQNTTPDQSQEPVPGRLTPEQQQAAEAAKQAAERQAQIEAQQRAQAVEQERQRQIQAQQEAAAQAQAVEQERQRQIQAQQEAAAQAQAQAEAARAAKEAQDLAAFNVDKEAEIVQTGGTGIQDQTPIVGLDPNAETPKSSTTEAQTNKELDLKALFKDFDPIVQGSAVGAFKLYFAYKKLSNGDAGAEQAAHDALADKLVQINNMAINSTTSEKPAAEKNAA